MTRKSALAAAVAALLTPALAGALGLGNIQVTSALNEPLQARIPLRGAAPGEIEELRAGLASEEQFERAGLERAFVLSRLRFAVVETGAGAGYLEVTTRDPIAEPFLNFLVDVSWTRGRVLREYTLLLDPPVYGAAISTGSGRSVQTVTALPEPGVAATSKAAPAMASTAAPTAAPTSSSSAQPRYDGDRYGPVRDGETLWSIADRTRPAGTSIQSMMLAILKANPEAFSIDNVNALRTGSVLRLPPASEISTGKAAAMQEVARQHGLWDEYRQSLGATVASQPSGSAAAPAAQPGAAPPAGAGTQAQAGSGSGSELRLLGAGSADAGTGGGESAQALRNELAIAQEEVEAARRENEELKSRLGDVEGLVEDLNRLVQLKEDQIAALQQQLARQEQAAAAETPGTAQPEAGAETPAEKETMAAGSETEPTMKAEAPPPAPEPEPKPEPEPEPKPALAPPPPPPPQSFLDQINSMLPVPLWTVLAGIGALLLGLGGARFVRNRRAAGDEAAEADAEDLDPYAATELPADADEAVTEMPATPAPAADERSAGDEDEDKTEMAAAAVSTQMQDSGRAPDEDPLAEVNVYLAYERFDQAEKLVRDAIAAYPDRHEYRLKLLEVFYAAKNAAAFEAGAAELRDVVGEDHAMMQQASEWWNDLGAGRALFGGEDSSGPDTEQRPAGEGGGDDDLFDVTASDSGGETGVDFDLGFESGEGDEERSGALDFDLGGDEEGTESGAGSLDFDLGFEGDDDSAAQKPAAGASGDAAADSERAESASGGDTGLDFDLGGLDEADEPAAGEAERRTLPERAGDEDDLSFDLSFGESESADDDESARDAVDSGGEDSGLDFDLGDTTTLDSRDEDDSAKTASAGGDDSALDFDLGDSTEFEGIGKSASTGGDDSALDFDLGDTTETGDAAKAAPAGGDESGLDFDLGDTTDTGDAAKAAPPGGDESGLDFDLGDTSGREESDDATSTASDESELDFDLGDTTGLGDSAKPQAPADDESELDFDLGDTTGLDDAARRPSADDGASSLDLDVGDATESDDTEKTSSLDGGDTGLDLDFGADTDADRSAATGGDDSALDLDLGDGDERPGGADFQDAATQVSDGSELDFDLGDTGTGDEQSGSFDTVQLSPDAAAAARDDDEEKQYGVDTEFRDIFASDSGDAGDDSASESSALDFDLGSDDPGRASADGDATDDDMDTTQFMLRDLPGDDGGSGDDDDEGHTLVLGRGESGQVDEIQTKLDLAQAYMDMGDTEGARNLLGEVMAEGSDEQKDQAKGMLGKLS